MPFQRKRVFCNRTYTATDIATLWLNRPRGRFSENCVDMQGPNGFLISSTLQSANELLQQLAYYCLLKAAAWTLQVISRQDSTQWGWIHYTLSLTPSLLSMKYNKMLWTGFCIRSDSSQQSYPFNSAVANNSILLDLLKDTARYILHARNPAKGFELSGRAFHSSGLFTVQEICLNVLHNAIFQSTCL